MSQQSDRNNQGKLRWSLVDFKSIEEMVKVLEFGASKYTKNDYLCIENLLKLCKDSVQIIQIEKLSPEDYVGLAMTDNSKLQILSINGDRELTMIHGLLKTQEKQENTKEQDKEATHLSKKGQKGKLTTKPDYSKSMDLHQNNTRMLNRKDALFAGQKNVYMLTMTTLRENSVEFYVVSAIKDLECLTMMYHVLKGRGIISEEVSISNNNLVIPGKDNWKKGLNREETLESLQRHLIEVFSGNELDEESTCHHMGHIMCNAMFYMYHLRNNSFSPERNNPFVTKVKQ